MIKTIIFDFGNVIGFFSHRLASSRLAYFAGVPRETMHGFLFQGGIEDDIDSGKLGVAELLRRVREKFTIGCADEFLELALADMFWPNREVCELIPRLKSRYRLLLGSNTNELHTRRFKKQFAETLEHFDTLILSYVIGVCKPDKAFFDYCQRSSQAEPGECLFIDDMPANVAGAQAFGWNAVLYQGYADLKDRMETLGVDTDARIESG